MTAATVISAFTMIVWFPMETELQKEPEKVKAAEIQVASDTLFEIEKFQFMQMKKQQAYQDYLEDKKTEYDEYSKKNLELIQEIQLEQKKALEQSIKDQEDSKKLVTDVYYKAVTNYNIDQLLTELQSLNQELEETADKLERLSKLESKMKSGYRVVYPTRVLEFKSYMPYTAITNESSDQWKLQHSDECYTGDYGIRMVNGRYCVAVGSAFTTKIGTWLDVVLTDGTVIECVLADCKADVDTDSTHTYCVYDETTVEFVIDKDVIDPDAKKRGSFHIIDGWEAGVEYIVVYDGE